MRWCTDLWRRHVSLGSIGGALILGAAVAAATAPAAAAPIYSNDFEGNVGSEWSTTATSTTPIGARRFLGEFVNHTVALTLGGLPRHAVATVTFDLFILRSWDGSNVEFGPDVFRLRVEGGPELIRTTFNNVGGVQAYPGRFPDHVQPRHSGAAEVATLGYDALIFGTLVPGHDSVYRLAFTFAHVADALRLLFSAEGLQEDPVRDELWGVDNVRVSVASAPASLLLIVAAVALAAGRRCLTFGR